MMKRLDAMLLTIVGLSVTIFSLTPNYGLLMHPKFQWLSFAGGLLVLVMGLVSLRYPSPHNRSAVVSFLLLIGIVILGQAFTRNQASSGLLAPPVPEALGIDAENYPLEEIRVLQQAIQNGEDRDSYSFSALGTLNYLTLPDSQTQPAFMRSYMACCAADALAIGFRMTSDLKTSFGDGDWIVISGTLRKLSPPHPLPSFRLGTATFATVNDAYVLEPKAIVDYTTTLPSITELLDTPSTAAFTEALKATELWEQLKGPGPFTILAPMNQALEDQILTEQDLARHILLGRFRDQAFFNLDQVETLAGDRLTIQAENGRLKIEGVRFVFKNKLARNGMVHIIYPSLE